MPRDPRRLEAALARVLRPLTEAIAELAATQVEPVALVLEPTPDVTTVRNLGLEHLGRWVYFPGRPAKLGPRIAQEPSVIAIAGRLVGIRAGKLGVHTNEDPTRVLIIAQGSALAELTFSVVDRVDIAPREW